MDIELFKKAERIQENITELEKFLELSAGSLQLSDSLGKDKMYLTNVLDTECKLFDDIQQALLTEIKRLRKKFEDL